MKKNKNKLNNNKKSLIDKKNIHKMNYKNLKKNLNVNNY